MPDIHDCTKRDFLVYVDGFGVYINVLFARKHNIRQGQSVSKSLLNQHYAEVPPMDATTSHIWLSEDQIERSDETFEMHKSTWGRTQ